MVYKSQSKRSFLCFAILIFWLGLWLRSENAPGMPLFLDEGIHIDWARKVIDGKTFAGLIDNKFLYPIYLFPFQLTGPEAVGLARVLSGLISMISLACSMALGGLLGGRRTALIAGLFYAVMPLAVFHDRQALVDPLMTAFTGLTLIGVIHLVRRPHPLPALILFIGLAGAYLTKTAALPYFGIPFAAVILIGKGKLPRLQALAWSIAAVVLAYGAFAWVLQAAAAQNVAPGAVYQARWENTVFGTGLDPTRLQSDLLAYLEILMLYVGWPALLLILLGIGHWLWQRKIGVALFLLLPAVAFVAIPFLAMRPAGGFVARYILATVIPTVAMAAYGLGVLLNSASSHRGWAAASVIALLAVMAHTLAFDVSLIYTPLSVPLAQMDIIQYRGDPSGIGRVEIAQDLLDEWNAAPDHQYHVLYVGFHHQIAAFLGPRLMRFERVADYENQDDRIEEWLANGDQVYLVYQLEPPVVRQLENFSLEPISERLHPSGPTYLFKISGAHGDSAHDLYDHFAPDRQDFRTDYEALAQALAQSDPETLIAMLPAAAIPEVEMASGRSIEPILPEQWPLDPESAAQAAAIVPFTDAATPVEIILANEAKSDPNLALRLAFQQQLFAVDQSWFGPLHRIRFLTGPAELEYTPLEVAYEGTIHLTDIAIVDQQITAGTPIRVALQWQTDQLIEDSYAVFVHLVDEAGNLQAQYDSIPGLGLLAMPSWGIGQTITDRFVIQTPPTLSEGVYTLRVGIYMPGTDLRLRVVATEEGAGDYAVVGQIEVIAIADQP